VIGMMVENNETMRLW